MIRQRAAPHHESTLPTEFWHSRSSRNPVVAATVRLSREIRRQFDAAQIAAGRVVWDAAQILPIDAWLTACFRQWLYSRPSGSSFQLLGLSQERAIWEQIIRCAPEGHTLLHVADTADEAFHAWNLVSSWAIPLDASEWKDSSDTEAFHGWASQFRSRLERNNWISNAELAGFLTARLAEGEIPVPERIDLAGFVERTPAQNELLQAFQRAGSIIEERVWAENDEEAEHSTRVRLGLPDQDAEIKAAARWALRLLRLPEDASVANPNGPRIGIVVPDLAGYRSRIERIFSETLHPDRRLRPDLDPHRLFNISLGPRLRDYPLVDAAMRVLGFSSGNNEFEETSRFLRSRFLEGAEDEFTQRALLDRRLRALGEPDVDVSMLIRIADQEDKPHHCPTLVRHLSAWQLAHRELMVEQLPSDWAVSLSGLLEQTGWPGDRALSSVEYQTSGAWRELLSEFSGLDAAIPPVSLGRACSMLDRLASARQFQPESDPAPIQILGLFEVSGLGFDHLWLMGSHDGAWPASEGPHPFLPLRLQRRLNLPGSSPSRELEFARTLSQRILGSAPLVVVSHPALEGDTELRPSRLFADLPETTIETIDIGPEVAYLDQMRQSSDMESIEDHEAPRLISADGQPTWGGTSIFKWQAACPFRAFAELRLGADGLRSPDPGLGPLERGQLIHEALERIWGELESQQKLINADPDHVDTIVRLAVGAVVHSMSDHRAVLRKPRFARIEQARLIRLISDWLELEKQRQPFTVIRHEVPRQVEVGGVRLAIRADRVDRIADGSQVVIDYKTGVHGPAEWEGYRPDEPQLPLYASTADTADTIGGVFFGVLKAGATGFRGAAVSEGLVPGLRVREDDAPLEKRIEAWSEVLDQLGRDFQAGVAVVDPKKASTTCASCSLTALCRINEAVGVTEGDRSRV